MSWACPYDTPSGCSRTGRDLCEPRSRGCILLRKFPLATSEGPADPNSASTREAREEAPDVAEIRRRLSPAQG